MFRLSCSLLKTSTSFVCSRNVSAVALWSLKYPVAEDSHPVDSMLDDVSKAIELLKEG